MKYQSKVFLLLYCAGISGIIFFPTGCLKNKNKSEMVFIDGSSTVYPITVAIDREFEKTGRNILISVGISGTTGGFQRFTTGEIDIANASRPINREEAERCKIRNIEFIELPIAFDGLAVVVHPENTWCEYLTISELKRMWSPEAEGKIMKWSDIRNGWPDYEIKLFGAGDKSGTYDYFTAAVVGTEHSSREDFNSSEDDHELVKGIAANKYALGFFGYGCYAGNSHLLRLLAIDDENETNGVGPILPSVRTVSDGTYQPFSRPIFIYVNKQSLLKKKGVKEYIGFYLTNARKLVREVGYIPLSASAYSMALSKVAQLRTGSAFGGGSKIGVSIDELFRNENEPQNE